MRGTVTVCTIATIVLFASIASGQAPSIISTSPTQNALNVPVSANISVTFNLDINDATMDSSTIAVNASSSGLHGCTISYDNPSRTVTLDPYEDFTVGEVVTVLVTRDIESATAIPLDESFAWAFTVEVSGKPGAFALDSNYVTPQTPEGIYSADLDKDGDNDIVTSDRSGSFSVFRNKGDGKFEEFEYYFAEAMVPVMVLPTSSS